MWHDQPVHVWTEKNTDWLMNFSTNKWWLHQSADMLWYGHSSYSKSILILMPIVPWGPFDQHELISFPVWISNRVHHKMWAKIIHTIPNFEWHEMGILLLLIHAGIKSYSMLVKGSLVTHLPACPLIIDVWDIFPARTLPLGFLLYKYSPCFIYKQEVHDNASICPDIAMVLRDKAKITTDVLHYASAESQ